MDLSDSTHSFTQRTKDLPDEAGVYVLYDLDESPLYVGSSRRSVRDSVRRELAGEAKLVGRRQIDPWEVAFIQGWPADRLSDVQRLTQVFLYDLGTKAGLVNAMLPERPGDLDFEPLEPVRVQLLPREIIAARRSPVLRFPRQIQHFNSLVDYILNTQDKPHLRRALQVYFNRLSRYFHEFLLNPEDAG